MSVILCDDKNARKCPQLQGVFSYMKNWGNNFGECGLVGNSCCAKGKDYVSEPGSEYYAYCAKKQGMEIILRFIKTKTSFMSILSLGNAVLL